MIRSFPSNDGSRWYWAPVNGAAPVPTLGHLEWYRCEERPCLCGDDVHVAVEFDTNRAHMLFDGVLRTFRWSGSREDFVRTVCLTPEALDDLEV